MGRYVMVVMTGPNDGMDEEFNRFLDEEHLPDVLGADGLASAQRFRVIEQQPVFASQSPELGYLTLYEIECDDVGAAIASLEQDREGGRWRSSPSPSPRRVCAVYEPLGPVVVKR